jgi:hypothetical protein
VFTTREAAKQAGDAANYPNGLKSGEPRAPGQFSSLRIAGAEIYMSPEFDFGHLARVDGARPWLGDEAAGV